MLLVLRATALGIVLAAQEGHSEIVSALIASGIDVDSQDEVIHFNEFWFITYFDI